MCSNVVLVHGGFVDGSGWQGVYDLLTADGFNVSVVQNQTLSLEGDVETTHNVLDLQDGPAILVGHSYGGAVITEAGTHDAVAALVYITRVRARPGRVGQHADRRPAARRAGAADPAAAGRLPVPRPGEVRGRRSPPTCPAREAAFMADSQVPWGVEALGGAISEPAWRSKPSWYLVATEDRMIPPPAAADDGRAGRRDDDRGDRQPRHLRLPAGRRRQPDLTGGAVAGCDDNGGLTATPAGRRDTQRPAGRGGAEPKSP